MRRRIVVGVVVAVLATALAACSERAHHAVPLRPQAGTANYLPGLGADLFPPQHVRRAPLVVLIPGGGWVSADRSGLRPLADRLAAHGIVAVTATYRAAGDGVRFPVPVADIECAVDFAAARTQRAGMIATRVLVLGHSSGAHLIMLAALTGQRFRASCPYPPTRIDGVIGLAGPYDIMSFEDVAQPLLGRSAAAAPSRWRAANPVTWVRKRPSLPMLLAHGADDTTVSPTFTTTFGEQLRKAGHPVRVEIVPGADHASIYQPSVIVSRLIAWIDTLHPATRS